MARSDRSRFRDLLTRRADGGGSCPPPPPAILGVEALVGPPRRRHRFLLAAVAAMALAATAAAPAAASDGTDPPAVPAGLVTEVSHDAVTVSWDDPNDSTVTGYVILRRDKAVHAQGDFETVAAGTGNAQTSYVDLSVKPGRRYVYRIQAINAAGTSDRSTRARAYTPAAPKPSPLLPAKPTGLAAGVTHDSVTLSWDDPRDDTISGYAILRRDKDVHNRGTFHTINPDTGTADTTYTDTTAEPERRYIYRIKAITAHGYSKTSAYHRTDTPPAPEADTTTPPAPEADTTTLTPPAHTPEWVRGLVIGYTSHTANNGLAAPTEFQIETFNDFTPGNGKVPVGVTLRSDSVADAEGYQIYILATREINGVVRDWWVVPSDEDDQINILSESDRFGRYAATLTVFEESDTPSFAPDHLVIAVSAYREASGTPSESDWRVAVLNFAEETVSYDLYDEFD